ncbi:MAG: M48 family metallopeptidase [Clostridia bacterium]|nr:M48 family metallopeptidase [Clostridia bacterium]
MTKQKSTPRRNSTKAKQRTKTVDLSGIPVTVTRKRMKTMRLRVVRADLSVRLSVPLSTSDEKVMLFLSSREAWIRETLEALRATAVSMNDEVTDGAPIDLWGVRYLLRIEETGNRYQVSPPDPISGEVLYRVPKGSSVEKRTEHLRDFYKEALASYVAQILPTWEKITDLHPLSYDFRFMKSRWGSCNTKTRHIRLNLRLAQRPKICTEYVLVHELCHLKHPNHGKEFHALQESFLPNAKEIRALLNGK